MTPGWRGATTLYLNIALNGSGTGGKLQVGDNALIALPAAITLEAGTLGGALLMTSAGASQSVTVELYRYIAMTGMKSLITSFTMTGGGIATFITSMGDMACNLGDGIWAEVTAVSGSSNAAGMAIALAGAL